MSEPELEPPPFLRTWPRVYGALALELLLLIVAFYALTQWAS